MDQPACEPHNEHLKTEFPKAEIQADTESEDEVRQRYLAPPAGAD